MGHQERLNYGRRQRLKVFALALLCVLGSWVCFVVWYQIRSKPDYTQDILFFQQQLRSIKDELRRIEDDFDHKNASVRANTRTAMMVTPFSAISCRSHMIVSTFRCTGQNEKEDGCNNMRRLIEFNTKRRAQEIDPVNIAFLTVPTDTTVVPQNKFGMPTLRGILSYVATTCPNATSYTFINGDIFIGPGLIDTVEGVRGWMKNRAEYINDPNITPTHFLIVAPRVDTPWNIKWQHTSKHVESTLLPQAAEKIAKRKFNEWAQDTFVFSPGALRIFLEKLDPQIVVGRVGFDNFMVETAYREPLIALVFSGTFYALHQIDPSESVGGSNSNWKSKATPDRLWNPRYTYPIVTQDPMRFGSLRTTLWTTLPSKPSSDAAFFTGITEKTPIQNKVFVSLRNPVSDPVLRHAKDDASRRKHLASWRQKTDWNTYLQIYLISYGNISAFKKLYNELESTIRLEMKAKAE